MKTAHPASLPPGPRSSGGIRRSTAASISAASSAVKNIHGPGRTSVGGLAAPGSHGRAPFSVRARATVEPATSSAAVDASIARRVKFDEYGASIAGLVFRGLIGRETAGQRMPIYLSRFGGGLSATIIFIRRGTFRLDSKMVRAKDRTIKLRTENLSGGNNP